MLECVSSQKFVDICNIIYIQYQQQMNKSLSSSTRSQISKGLSMQKRKQKQPLLKTKYTQKPKLNKSVEQPKRIHRVVSKQTPQKPKPNPLPMGILIEQQKTSQLQSIQSSVALNYYYTSLMSLFAVIYNCSQIIFSNIFQQRKLTTGLTGLRFVGIIFNITELIWNKVKHNKLKKMAKNVMKMGSTHRIFQDKIQFICRKITLNHNMKKRIQMSFLNTKLDNFWSTLINKYQYSLQINFLEDLYETAPQKMAYWDFSYFVNQFLSDESFYTILQQSMNEKKQIEMKTVTPGIHHFTYEFVVIEIFCFHQEEADRRKEEMERASGCQII